MLDMLETTESITQNQQLSDEWHLHQNFAEQ
jgi:hypothetical protein